MGVNGLLVLLKPAIRECNLKRFRGQSCVIDIMGWLYRGAFSSAYSHQGQQHETLGFMNFSLKMLKLLLSFDIKPICVFDGRPHEGKTLIEKKRSEDKKKNEALAKKAENDGNKDDARKYHTRSLFIKSK